MAGLLLQLPLSYERYYRRLCLTVGIIEINKGGYSNTSMWTFNAIDKLCIGSKCPLGKLAGVDSLPCFIALHL